jgi:hypothetical protein
MTEQELRAWSLAIAALIQKNKPSDFTNLLKATETISAYIKTGELPSEKDYKALYEW